MTIAYSYRDPCHVSMSALVFFRGSVIRPTTRPLTVREPGEPLLRILDGNRGQGSTNFRGARPSHNLSQDFSILYSNREEPTGLLLDIME